MSIFGGGMTPTQYYADLNILNDRFNILNYGAVGDNNTDNTTAIQNSINAAHAIGGGIVYVPTGIFKTGALTTYSYVRIVGDGIRNSILRSNSVATMFTCTETVYTSWLGFKDIQLDGNNVGTIAYTANLECDFAVNEIYVRNFTTKGFNLTGHLIGEFNRCIFQNCGTAFYVIGDNNDADSNLLSFNGCEFYSNTIWAIQLVNGLLLRVNNCDISINGTNGNAATGGVCFTGGKGVPGMNMGLVMRQCWMESNYGTLIKINEPYATHENLSVISNCQLNYNNPVNILVTGASSKNRLMVENSAVDSNVTFTIDGALASLINDKSVISGTVTTTNNAKYFNPVDWNGFFSPPQLTASLTDDAPTQTEINTATGLTPSTAGAGWQCTIKDNSGTGLVYKIESDGTYWSYVKLVRSI